MSVVIPHMWHISEPITLHLLFALFIYIAAVIYVRGV